MPQSLAPIYLHIVFATKERKPFLADLELREAAHDYLGGICRNLDCPPIRIGGVADHVHILCRLGRGITVSDLLLNLKRDSSKWFKKDHDDAFAWQGGYGAFSVSPTHLDPLISYIESQEEHHRKVSFQDEFRRLCRKNGVEIDERYVWD